MAQAESKCPPRSHRHLEFCVSNFEFLLPLLLALVTLLAYLPVWHCGFVCFDDADYVTDNRMVQAGLTWTGVHWAFTTFHASNWHPLTWLSHMLDLELFGPGPRGPHLVNVLLHIASTVLLFLLLRRLTGARWRSAMVAALFALHPLHVESVAWIAERKDVLSGLFFMLTLWFWTRGWVRRAVPCAPSQSLEQSAGSGVPALPTTATGHLGNTPSTLDSRPSTLDYCLALLFFALGLMSKPMLVTLPFVLLLLDYWPMGRLAIGNVRSARARLVFEKLPFFALSIVSCVVTFIAQKQGGALQTLADYSLGERMANAVMAYARYLGRAFWPVDLAVLYPHPGRWPADAVALAVILVAGLCLASVRFARKFPFVWTGWFWFLGMLVPVIGLIQAGGQSMADRYTYLPLIGLFIGIAWGAAAFAARQGLSPAALASAAGVVLVVCAVRTGTQLRHWRDSESLFRHALEATSDNAAAHNNLAAVLLDDGRVDEALAHCGAALDIQPGYADARNNFGHALLQQGRIEEAIGAFRQALESRPGDAATRNHLGNALLHAHRFDEAIAEYEKALELQPGFAKAHNNLGWSLLQTRRVDQAIAHFKRALELDPQYANAHNNLALALLQQGRVREALAHCRSAVKLQPDDPGTLSNLAWLLATWPEDALRDGAEAVELAQRANRLSGSNNPMVLRALAAAYAETGRFGEAITAARQALRLTASAPDAGLSAALRKQLEQYEAGSPFRDRSRIDE